MNYDSQRWISLVASILASVCAGLAYSWSVFLNPLSGIFGWSATDTALSFTLLMSTAAATAIVAGKAQDYIQPRTVILIGGILFGGGLAAVGFINSLAQMYICVVVAGIGLGAVYPGGTMSNMVKFFPDKSGSISGLISAGYGIGPVVLAPISVFLLNSYGIISTMKILGISFMIIIVLLSRLVTTAPEGYKPTGWVPVENKAKKPAIDKNWRKMLRDTLFWPLAIVFTLGEITGMMIIGHASPIAQDMLNISAVAAAAVVSILSLANTFGKVFWGFVSDKIGRYPIIACLLIFGGIAMLALTMVSSYIPFVLCFIVIGLCYGGFLAVMAPLTADLFGPKNLPINYGIMFLTVALAAYVGPLLASLVKEANNGDYSGAFFIAALLNLVGLAIFGLFLVIKNRKQKRFATSEA